jgi:hypothetical protein
MNRHDRLRQLLATEQERQRATFPAARRLALTALARARDSWYLTAEGTPDPAPPTDVDDKARRYVLGWNRALQLCFENAPDHPGIATLPVEGEWDAWSDRLIQECGRLGEAELVLAQCETGFLQLQQTGERTFDAWVATRTMPTEWREREDFAWWTAALARRLRPDLDKLAAARPAMTQRLRDLARRRETPADWRATDPAIDDDYRQLGAVYAARMSNQYSYPAGASIGGITFQIYLDLLGLLIGWLLKHLDGYTALGERQEGTADPRPGLATPQSEAGLVEALASALTIDGSVVRDALRCWTLDRENAAYHGAMPGSPAPPFLRIDDDHLIWSAAGLLTTPFLFLTRELKRRHGREYHNTAYLREDVFRQDLYALFQDKRFVKSAGPVELKRAGGEARTDLDALIFDRKSGTLGIFELKAQDPFPRSTAERQRQRDNFYHANAQISALGQWLQRNDPSGLLARIDPRAARTFKVQRVYLFVLGRYLAHFADGPASDRRAAWGTWPQVLRLVGERPAGPSDPNPLGSLHAKLVKDAPLSHPGAARGVREILIGAGQVRVYPSFAAYKQAVE